MVVTAETEYCYESDALAVYMDGIIKITDQTALNEVVIHARETGATKSICVDLIGARLAKDGEIDVNRENNIMCIYDLGLFGSHIVNLFDIIVGDNCIIEIKPNYRGITAFAEQYRYYETRKLMDESIEYEDHCMSQLECCDYLRNYTAPDLSKDVVRSIEQYVRNELKIFIARGWIIDTNALYSAEIPKIIGNVLGNHLGAHWWDDTHE